MGATQLQIQIQVLLTLLTDLKFLLFYKPPRRVKISFEQHTLKFLELQIVNYVR